jgi:hypothetical protein
MEGPAEGAARAPYRTYLDRDVYDTEHERIFRDPTWNEFRSQWGIRCYYGEHGNRSRIRP